MKQINSTETTLDPKPTPLPAASTSATNPVTSLPPQTNTRCMLEHLQNAGATTFNLLDA